MEVMVTLVIVSVASLGMAGLQTATLRANSNALMESQAATLMQDIIERIRANPTGDYTVTLNELLAVDINECQGASANCDVTRMADYDLKYWKCAIGSAANRTSCNTQGVVGQLPQGDGSITLAGNVYTITIQWFEASSNSNKSIVVISTI